MVRSPCIGSSATRGVDGDVGGHCGGDGGRGRGGGLGWCRGGAWNGAMGWDRCWARGRGCAWRYGWRSRVDRRVDRRGLVVRVIWLCRLPRVRCVALLTRGREVRVVWLRHLLALGLVASEAKLRRALEHGRRPLVTVEASSAHVLPSELPARMHQLRRMPPGLQVTVRAAAGLLPNVNRMGDLLEVTKVTRSAKLGGGGGGRGGGRGRGRGRGRAGWEG